MDLAKIDKKEKKDLKSAIWLHRAREMPTAQFRQAIEKELTGKETEP